MTRTTELVAEPGDSVEVCTGRHWATDGRPGTLIYVDTRWYAGAGHRNHYHVDLDDGVTGRYMTDQIRKP